MYYVAVFAENYAGEDSRALSGNVLGGGAPGRYEGRSGSGGSESCRFSRRPTKRPKKFRRDSVCDHGARASLGTLFGCMFRLSIHVFREPYRAFEYRR